MNKERHYTYKFRLYPTDEQKVLLSKHFGCTRFVYNYFLRQRIDDYELKKNLPKEDRKYLSKFDQSRFLTELKKQDEYSFLNEVSRKSLVDSLFNLDDAYKRFFKTKKGFPRFKSKKNRRDSFTHADQNYIINDGKNTRFKTTLFKEGIPMVKHREIFGKIKACTISRSPSGKYYVSILTEQEFEPLNSTNKSIGIDLGIKDLIITSDGDKYDNSRYTAKYAKQLKTASKHLARKKKGSKSYERQRIKTARIHEKIVNSRKNTLHNITTDLVRKNDVICVENLNVKGMVRNRKLSKHISDASWGALITMLKYKSEWNNKQIIEIDRFFPSSKTCSNCGHIYKELRLSERKWTCSKCNTTHDRDVNAAKNIKSKGFELLNNPSAESVDYSSGVKTSGENQERMLDLTTDGSKAVPKNLKRKRIRKKLQSSIV